MMDEAAEYNQRESSALHQVGLYAVHLAPTRNSDLTHEN